MIWFVQIVHYPLFGRGGREGFADYSVAHSSLTGLVVGPPMLVEAATSVALAVRPPEGLPFLLPLLGLVLLAVVWLSTALLQSPQHGVLRNLRAHSQLSVTKLTVNSQVHCQILRCDVN